MTPSTEDMRDSIDVVSTFPPLASQVSPLHHAIVATTAPFEDIYARDPYIISPHYGLSTFLDMDSSFDHQHMPVGTTCSFPTEAQTATAFTPHVSAIQNESTIRPRAASTGSQSLGPYPSNLYLNHMSMGQAEQAYFPLNEYTPARTSSLVSDEQHRTVDYSNFGPRIMMGAPSYPSTSPRTASTSQPTSSLQPSEPLQRKRGHSLFEGSGTVTHTPDTFTPTSKIQRSRRLPHNQIERRYREGLHSEFERLRRAVPSLSQSDDGAQTERLKPTKAMVFSRAVEYIRRLEKEVEILKEENEKLMLAQTGRRSDMPQPHEEG